VHPWLQRRDLVAWCKAHDITVEAYSPLAKARCLDDPVLAGVARRAAGTPAQVLLAWSLAKGLTPLVKSSNPARQRENLRLLELSAADTACLDNLERGLTTGWDPCSSHPVL
jgi:diketogulonate reductase-like aldo/keto reductase